MKLFRIMGGVALILNSAVLLGLDEEAFHKKVLGYSEIKSDDYTEPFLISQISAKVEASALKTAEGLASLLQEGTLGLKAHFSKTGVSMDSFKSESFKLPEMSVSKDQLEGVEKCNQEKCLMKLNIEEIKKLELSQSKTKIFTGFLFDRLMEYRKSKKLLGYDDRASNVEFVQKMVNLHPRMERYPKAAKFLHGSFWKNSTSIFVPIQSWIKTEMAIIAPDKMQPILRISEDFEFKEGLSRLFFEMPIYSNHYFDSSTTFYEVLPLMGQENKSLVVISDVMEVDELKKSAFIRALFKGKMVQAVSKYQVELVEKLRKRVEKPTK